MDENIEQMAKEYKEVLERSEEENTPMEQLILAEENQLELLNGLTGVRSTLSARTIAYLKNLIFRSLKEVNTLLGREGYIPSISNRMCNMSNMRAVLSLYDIQLSIYVLLDKIPSAPSALLVYENRKMPLLVALMK